MLKTGVIGFILLFLILGLGSCSSAPLCHLNATNLYIKRDPCSSAPPTREESRRRRSAHRL